MLQAPLPAHVGWSLCKLDVFLSVCTGLAGISVASNLTQPFTTAQPRLVSDTLGLYETPARSRCSAAAQALLTALADGFQSQNALLDSTQATQASGTAPSTSSSTRLLFRAQPGYVDFGFAGTPVTAGSGSSSNITGGSDAVSECQPACSYSNPAAAYGVTVLPLAPGEDRQAKVADPLTPRHEAQNLDGRYGPGYAPSWQLQQDEVVLLAGCLPPAEASRWEVNLTAWHDTSGMPHPLGQPYSVAVLIWQSMCQFS